MTARTAWTLLDSEDVAWLRDDDALPTTARGAAASLARRIGLNDQRVAEVSLAVSEAATNLRRHAVDGAILLRVLRTASSAAVEFVSVDSGPGMADVTASMSDGTSTAGTLGIGLGALARLADSFDIHSLPGRGTVMIARFWPRDAATRAGGTGGIPAGEPVVAGLTRPISGEESCGDAWCARIDTGAAIPAAVGLPPRRENSLLPQEWADRRPRLPAEPLTVTGDAAILVMLCDGLGHGPLAALVAAKAVAAFRASPARHPEAIIRDLHLALRGTRGGAVAVARIEPDAGRVLLCGVGNVSGFVITPDHRSTLMSTPGIVGHQMRTLRTFEQPLPTGAALVLHSDGLTERWTPESMPGLLRHSPTVIAGQVLREAAVRRDDAGIVVAKGSW
ncbi:ATP-binding SpoIIE family protein phosphatase [Streptomyces sp. H39-S7]|uniref:ATP-binding SpoIIE family protein phosphatase n=1 Tax=Streptomyces sp. H39-S7 TaxID=3004357 RepID=UPI0022AED96D|nr:ATP-binding SpoIIE family protein phosphatase [Streptomyces sp. H39-S7]MCZ4119932.1 ATP-binding protein/SpoIIE family protein phosphatase [Streptomyces sp. H39-S7]